MCGLGILARCWRKVPWSWLMCSLFWCCRWWMRLSLSVRVRETKRANSFAGRLRCCRRRTASTRILLGSKLTRLNAVTTKCLILLLQALLLTLRRLHGMHDLWTSIKIPQTCSGDCHNDRIGQDTESRICSRLQVVRKPVVGCLEQAIMLC